MGNAPLQRFLPLPILPGQLHHFTTGVVVVKEYWNFDPLQPLVQPQSIPNAQPNAQAVSVGTQQAIKRKRKAALERLANKRATTMLKTPMCGRESEGEVVFAIEEMIGHPKTWPSWIKDIFFLRKLNRTNRLNIITFTLGNGLPPHVLHQWIAVRQVECDKAKFNVDLEAVLQSMTLDPGNKLAQKYFYFDLVLQEYCFMNGIPRNNITNTCKGQKEAQSPP